MSGLTGEKVFEAADAIVSRGAIPTQEGIRELLRTGSKTTIHKYLRQWKEQRFGLRHSTGEDKEELQRLIYEKEELEQLIAKQIQQHENLTSQLMETEFQCTEAREKNHRLERELLVLKEEHAKTSAELKSLQAAHQGILEERSNAIQTILQDKNQEINSLKEELKELNQIALKELRETSYRGDEVLMEEKVKALNFKSKIAELEGSIQQLQEQLERAQQANQPLRKEVERQRQLIAKHVNFQQLQAEQDTEEFKGWS